MRGQLAGSQVRDDAPSNGTDHSVSKQQDTRPRSLAMLFFGATHTHCPLRTCTCREARGQAGYVIPQTGKLPGLLLLPIKDRPTGTAQVSGSHTAGVESR